MNEQIVVKKTMSGVGITEIAARTRKVTRPENILLVDVLNYVDTAGIRQMKIICKACGHRLANALWQVKNCKERRVAV